MAADPDCLFCKIVAGEIPATRVAEDDRTIAFMDINPATRGHVLVSRASTRRTCWRSTRRTSRRSRRPPSALAATCRSASAPTASTCSTPAARAAWQTVFHFHMHVIPRYDADPLRLPWMPEPGDRDEIAAAARDLEG